MNVTEEAKHSHHASPLTGFGSLPLFGPEIFDLHKQSMQMANKSKKHAYTGRAQSVLDRVDSKNGPIHQSSYTPNIGKHVYGGDDDTDFKQKTIIGIGKSKAKMHMKRRKSLWDHVAKEKHDEDYARETTILEERSKMKHNTQVFQKQQIKKMVQLKKIE